jgi:hypothetical protein
MPAENGDIDVFKKIKEESTENYYRIGEVHCPYLNKNISFNRKGIEHISMKDWNRARLISDQYLRFKFLKFVQQIINSSHTLQEYNTKKSFERTRVNARWEYRAVETRYYGFVAILKNVRIKIVVKDINQKQPYFWSVIPFWKQKNDPFTGSLQKVFCDGDLETQ